MRLQKAYIKDPNPFGPSVRRGIMNIDSGFVFIAGHGWMNSEILARDACKLLPAVYDQKQAFLKNDISDELWAWCYGVIVPKNRAPAVVRGSYIMSL